MADERRRTILEELARGNLTTDEAEHHFAALDSTEPTHVPVAAPLADVGQPDDAPRDGAGPDDAASDDPLLVGAGPDGARSDDSGVAPELAVHAQLSGGGMVEVAGDDTATEARVDGPNNCMLSTDGTRTKVSGQLGDEGLLVVPAHAELDIEVNSGEARLIGLRGVLRARLNVGDAVVVCALTRGHSTIDANAGDLRIVLLPDADVHVVVRCAADIGVDQRLHKIGRGEWTLGEGTARLEITGNLGSVSIGTER